MLRVFVTGLPRTGTTWVASLIAAATDSILAFEPYNWRLNPDAAKYHMKYLPARSRDPDFLQIARKAFGSNNKVVLKDVHCCLASEYLWEALRPTTVIVVRHPCAMANSWVKVNWEVRFRINILLKQHELVDKYLFPYVQHLRRSDDYFFQLGAYWGAAYYILANLLPGRHEWTWVAHEDLCRQPVPGFEALLGRLGLSMGHAGYVFLKENNRELAADEDPLDIPARITNQQPHLWKDELSPDQVQAVLEGASPFGIMQRYFTLPSVRDA